jgi:maltooligosyltrehalose trehalohydrolase
MASKLDWDVLEHAPASIEFRNLTKELLAIRRDKIVPLIKEGLVQSKAELLPAAGSQGGLDLYWRTDSGALLQMVANFSAQTLTRPPLINGETLWGGSLDDDLRPAEIIVRTARVPTN